jgi:hypothetical protein
VSGIRRRPSAAPSANLTELVRRVLFEMLVVQSRGEQRCSATNDGNARMTGRFTFREANAADGDAVLGLLNESAQWLLARGIRQWYVPFPRPLIENDLAHHRVFVATTRSEIVATAAALGEDPMFWGDQAPGSWYIHRLARRRDAPGAGRELLRWIETRAQREGVQSLRLDCGAGLRSYYESAGYELCWIMSLLESTSTPPRSLWFCYEKNLAV